MLAEAVKEFFKITWLWSIEFQKPLFKNRTKLKYFTTVALNGDPAGVFVYVLVNDNSRSIFGGSPSGGREERLWDMSISAMEKKTSSSRQN